MLEIVAICLVITALIAWVNDRFVGLPIAIGVMATALAISLALIVLSAFGYAQGLLAFERSLVGSIDFQELLMQGMLSLLLFAAALHVDLSELKAYRWPVIWLAVLGTLLSTALVGIGLHICLPLVGLELPLVYCLLFGALISPTDPIAVMGILKSAGAPHELELVMAGESLFNDGVGVVLFSLLLGVATGGETPSAGDVALRMVEEAGGGLLFGFVLGYVTFRLLKSVDTYQVEVLLTLAAVTGGYALAIHLGVSGPLAMVVTGLMIGNHGRALAMSDTTRRYVDMFWELLDEILNAVLFVLIGMEILLVEFSMPLLGAGCIAIAVTLVARLLIVGMPVALRPRWFKLPDGAWKVLAWGGLRGGIAVALALSIPAGATRDTLLALTYAVVVFSILVQGLTIGRVARRAVGSDARAAASGKS